MGHDASRRRSISAVQWLAARALSEGAPPTRNRVAAALGCDVSSVYVRAAAESWRCANYRPLATRRAWERFMTAAFGHGAFDGADYGTVSDAETRGAGSEAGGAADGPHLAGDPVRGTDFGTHAAQTDARARVGISVPLEDGSDEVPGFEPEAGPSPAEGDDPLEILSRATRFLNRQLSRIMREAESGGQISKQEIDNLAAMTRMMERLETLAKERATEEETNRDAKIAEALRKIDGRILKLAREEAERLVAEGHRPRDSSCDE